MTSVTWAAMKGNPDAMAGEGYGEGRAADKATTPGGAYGESPAPADKESYRDQELLAWRVGARLLTDRRDEQSGYGGNARRFTGGGWESGQGGRAANMAKGSMARSAMAKARFGSPAASGGGIRGTIGRLFGPGPERATSARMSASRKTSAERLWGARNNVDFERGHDLTVKEGRSLLFVWHCSRSAG